MCPVEAERAAPVVNDQCDAFLDTQCLPGGKQEFTMFDIAIAVRPRVIELVRVAHADKIDGNTAALIGQVRHDVAPEIGRSRVAMLKNNRVAFTDLDIGHRFAINLQRFFIYFCGGYQQCLPTGRGGPDGE